MFGAAAMSLSSFCVVSNALRLNLTRIYDTGKGKKRKKISGLEKAEAGTAEVERTGAGGMPVKGNKAAEKIENNESRKKENIRDQKEEIKMKKTMKIEGMMCGHCEASVKKALEALPQVDEAVVSHESGTAVVTLNGEAADDVLKQAVEAKDYKVISIA
jgi:Cu2+-exporting ATPase